MRPGIAFEYGAGGMSTKALLHGRTARLIVTMGMPSFVYRLWFMNHGLAALRRGILNFVGIKPVRESLYGNLAVGELESRLQPILRRDDGDSSHGLEHASFT